jgi:hypothetical protein
LRWAHALSLFPAIAHFLATSTQRFRQRVHNGIAQMSAQMFVPMAKRSQAGRLFSAARRQKHGQTQARNQSDPKGDHYRLCRSIVDCLFGVLIPSAHSLRNAPSRFLSGLAGFVQRVVNGLVGLVQGIVNSMTDPIGRSGSLSGGLVDEMFDRFPRFARAPLNSANQLLDSAVDMEQVVVGQFGPFALQFATNHVPFAFKYILGNHRKLLSLEK